MNRICHKTLRAVIDRVIPGDDFPAASENGVMDYFQRILTTDLSDQADFIAAGLSQLQMECDAQHKQPFEMIASADQDAILTIIEHGKTHTAWQINPAAWFRLVVRLTNEGYYADPGNGGNPNRASWKMIGYEPRRAL